MANTIYDELMAIQVIGTYDFDSDDLWLSPTYQTTSRPWRVDALWCVSTSVDPRVVEIALGPSNPGSNPFHFLGSVDVPAGAGTGGVPPVDILAAIFPLTVSGIFLAATDALWARLTAQLTLGERVTVLGVAGEL